MNNICSTRWIELKFGVKLAEMFLYGVRTILMFRKNRFRFLGASVEKGGAGIYVIPS